MPDIDRSPSVNPGTHWPRPKFTGYPVDIVKLRIDAPEDARIIELGALGELTYYRSLMYCRRRGTYTIPLAAALELIPSRPHAITCALERAGLWLAAHDGWTLVQHDDLFISWPTHKDSTTAASHRRRRARINYHHRAVLLERDGSACLVCGAGADLTIDHIVPISRGGSDDLSNLQVLCRRCNSSKKDRI